MYMKKMLKIWMIFLRHVNIKKKKELEEKKNIAFKSYQNIFLVKAQKIISFKINKEN